MLSFEREMGLEACMRYSPGYNDRFQALSLSQEKQIFFRMVGNYRV